MTYMNTVCANDRITLVHLAILQGDGSLGRIDIGDTAGRLQNRWLTRFVRRSRLPLELLVQADSVNQVPGMLPDAVRLLQSDITKLLVLGVVLGDLFKSEFNVSSLE